MKTSVQIFLLFLFLVINSSFTIAQKEKTYNLELLTRYSSVNLDSVHSIYFKFNSQKQLNKYLKDLSKYKNLSELTIYADEIENIYKIPNWFFEFSNIQNLRSLDIGFNLKEYPSKLSKLKKLKDLSLRGEKIFEIFPLKLLELTQLESLDLSFCNLVSSSKFNSFPDDFHKLVSLKKIKLDFNHINIFPEVLCKLDSLQELDISFSNLMKLPECFSELKQLKHLNASNNYLQTLPESFSNLNNLGYLNLTRNFLESLPSAILAMPNLEVLELSTNPLQHLPADMSRMEGLKKLGLRNPLFSFPSGIYTLKNLEELDLSFGTLGLDHFSVLYDEGKFSNMKDFNISDSIKMLTNLRSLKISNVQNLFTLPMELKDLPYLEELYLSSNDNLFRDSFPQVLLHLNNLKKLSLRSCDDIIFPKQLNNLKSLTSFTLTGAYKRSCLQEIPKFIFSLENLIELNLAMNDFTELPTEISNLRKLKTLNLANNKITTIPTALFELDIEKLDLSSNNLNYLPPEISNLSKLKVLDLSENQLTNLPSEITFLTSLEDLKISLNPFAQFPEVLNELTQLKMLIFRLEHELDVETIIESSFPLPLENLEFLSIKKDQLGDKKRVKKIQRQMPHLRIEFR